MLKCVPPPHFFNTSIYYMIINHQWLICTTTFEAVIPIHDTHIEFTGNLIYRKMFWLTHLCKRTCRALGRLAVKVLVCFSESSLLINKKHSSIDDLRKNFKASPSSGNAFLWAFNLSTLKFKTTISLHWTTKVTGIWYCFFSFLKWLLSQCSVIIHE